MDRYPPSRILAAAGLVIAAVSFASLVGAWGFEILGGVEPCPLCLEQRIPYYFALPAGLVVALLASAAPRLAALLLAAIAAAFVYNAGLGIYHAGAEWGFWPGPDTCAAGGDLSLGAGGGLRESLKHNVPVRCDVAAVRIFGISLAGYSVLISAALAFAGFYALWRARAWRRSSFEAGRMAA